MIMEDVVGKRIVPLRVKEVLKFALCNTKLSNYEGQVLKIWKLIRDIIIL